MPKNFDNIIPNFLKYSNSYFVAVTDIKGKYIYFNENYENTFNIEDEDHDSVLEELNNSKTINTRAEIIKKCIDQPTKIHDFEYKKFSKKELGFIWTKWEVSGCLENETLSAIIFIGHDITENVKNNDYIVKQDNFLEAIYNSTNEASTFVDNDLKIVFNNRKAKEITMEIFGKEAKIGDTSLDYYLTDIKDEFKTYYNRAFYGETISVDKFDGNKWWKITLFPVIDKFNKIVGVSNNIVDISEQKIKEKIIIETRNKYKNLIENSHGVIFSISKEGYFRFVSESIKSLLGYEVNEVENQLFFSFIHPDDKEDCFNIIKNLYKSKNKVSGIKFRALQKDGTYKWLIANGGPIFNEDGEIKTATATAIDIDSLVKREMKILEQNEALKKIAWNQSHIVRKPVANILGICQLLESEGSIIDLTLVDMLKNSVEELDKIIHENVIISNRFHFGKIEFD